MEKITHADARPKLGMNLCSVCTVSICFIYIYICMIFFLFFAFSPGAIRLFMLSGGSWVNAIANERAPRFQVGLRIVNLSVSN